MASRTFSSSVPQKAIISNTIRLGPLHTCAIAVLTTAHKAYKIAEALPGPMGFLSQKLANLIGPLFFVLQYQWLAILSFVDDQILTVENVIEYIIPLSGYVFDKIDDIVHVSDTLPARFDNAVDNFPAMIRKMPYLNWASAQLKLLLNFLVTILTDWEVHEKEIPIDSNSHEEMTDHSTITNESSFRGGGYFDDKDEHVKDIAKKIESDKNYKKTIVETGMKKKEDKKNEEIGEKDNETYYKEAKSENGKQKSILGKETDGTTCRRNDDETYFNPTCVKDSRSTGKKKARRKKMIVRMHV